ncbi:MAG: hypothetical protein KME22_03800 [Hassallia sp. WJT32-NPBG1]|jgi:hypothetical protein|nr:hypothetical protein [Hassallia sp. WJT32-NPBG1]
MSDVHISGIVANTNMNELDKIFKQLFHDCPYSIENMSELYVENVDFDIFIQDDSVVREKYPKGNYDYLVSGLHNGDLDKAQNLLNEIASALEAHNLKYSFEFFEENSQGVEKEKQHIIRHPDF